MKQRYLLIVLLTLAGFMAGMIVAHLLGAKSWLDAKIVITLCTGMAFMGGHLLTKKDD
jgi:uncharacterized membrane protein YccC